MGMTNEYTITEAYVSTDDYSYTHHCNCYSLGVAVAFAEEHRRCEYTEITIKLHDEIICVLPRSVASVERLTRR